MPLESNSKRLVPGCYIYRGKNGKVMTPHKLNGFFVLPRGANSQQGEVIETDGSELTPVKRQTLLQRFLNKGDGRSRK